MLVLSSLSDINECTAADQLCDFNADCINTHGSYICSCLYGFTGDGKSCQGKEILSLGQTPKLIPPPWCALADKEKLCFLSGIISTL